MNVYDFDKTIYDGDSTLDFYFFCLKKHPSIILCIPHQLIGALKYMLGKIDKTHFKEEFYCFLLKLGNVDDEVMCFWDQNEVKIKEWYKKNHESDDLVISASPYFLLWEICKRLGIQTLIASEVDKESGKYKGRNCYGEEKVRRYQREFCEPIENFYTDSKSDIHLARISRKAFLVGKKQIKEWMRNGECC